MRLITKTISIMALAAFSAAALDKGFVDQIVNSAQGIERDAAALRLELKAKVVDASAVKEKIDAMGADVDRLSQLVTQMDATAPQFSARDQADWKLVKDKVTLLGIFHNQKKTLAGDMAKNRGLLRTHAQGIALRAQKLQETALRLSRASVN